MKKYNYVEVPRIDTPNGRFYKTKFGNLPSVTTILEYTSSNSKKQGLKDWIERVGIEEAERQKQFASDVGTVMHGLLEIHNDRNIKHDFTHISQDTYFIGKRLANTLINSFGHKVVEVLGQEVALYHSSGFAGTSDLICVYNVDGQNFVCILDYKNAKTVKPRRFIEDYFIQLTAYAQAHNEMFGTYISKGIILMAGRDDTFEEYVLEKEEFNYYLTEWNKRVNTYNNSLQVAA